MPPDLAHVRRTLAATADLLLLELRLLTGNRLLVIGLVELLAFAAIALQRAFGDNPWDVPTYYVTAVVLPPLVPAIALGMAAVTGDRDTRQLEVTFATPAGRYEVWCFRLAAAAATGVGSAFALSVLVTVFLEPGHRAVAAALHAAVPLLFVTALTACLSVVFNGAATAGLAASGFVGLSWLVLHHGPTAARRFDLLLNPFDPPADILDPAGWFRIIVFNRTLYVTATAVCVAGFLSLLQARERLL